MLNFDLPDVQSVVEAAEFGGTVAQEALVSFRARLEDGFQVPYWMSVEQIMSYNRDDLQYIAQRPSHFLSGQGVLYHADFFSRS